MDATRSSIIDLWLNRAKIDRMAVDTARNAVAHLSPAVVVTGGSRGIGAEIAGQFARAGSRVVLVARDHPALQSTASEIAATSAHHVETISCDVTSPNAASLITKQLADQGHYLDILVNNAAMGLAGPFAEHSAADLDRLIALNITSLTRLARAALPDMLARRRGGILNVSSLGACVPGPNQAAYYASKSYVLSLTEALACEASGHGVRIAALLPGPVETTFHAAMGAENSLYRQLLPSLTAERAARAAYRGFTRGQRVIIPGLFNSATFVALRVLPHPISVPLVSVFLRRREK